MNKYIITEDRNFKTFLKENYEVAFNIWYLFTKKNVEYDANSAYGVFI